MPESTDYEVIIKNKPVNVRLEEDRLSVGEANIEVSIEATGDDVYSILLNNRTVEVHVHQVSDKIYTVSANEGSFEVKLVDKRDRLLQEFGLSTDNQSQELNVRAPMPGLVLEILVKEGDTVQEGTGLLILEAMKMENELRASASGTIKAIHVKAGEAIKKNDLLIEITD